MSSCKKIVITGASGFLGSHLVKRLKNDGGYKVYALSSRPDELKEIIGRSDVEYLHKNAFKESGEILKDAIVISCAYPRNSTGTAVADGLKYIQCVFEAAVENKAAAIINISSQSVDSQQRTEAATEETPVCLESPYAVGKYAVELILESICRGSSTAYTSLRMASLIGPGFDQRIVNRLVKQAIETGKVTVKRNQQRFGFFDVEDAVSGIIAVLNTDVLRWKSVYNLGRNEAYTLLEIAETIRTDLREICGAETVIDLVTGNEIGNTQLDCYWHFRDFNFEPAFSLKESVRCIAKQALM